jgi:hypothetical protein
VKAEKEGKKRRGRGGKERVQSRVEDVRLNMYPGGLYWSLFFEVRRTKAPEATSI